MAARKFLAACAAAAAIGLAAIATVNFIVDVNRIYHADDPEERVRVRDYVARLLSSLDGMVQVPWERAVKWEIARVSAAACVVTGSSRAMLFGRSQLESIGGDCGSVANLAVSGAGFEDFVTVAGMLIDKKTLRTVYIGIDPWAFRFDSDRRFTQFEAAYHEARRRLGLEPKRRGAGFDLAANLFNGRYLERNLESIFNPRAAVAIKQVERGGRNVADFENVTRPDGSLVYSRRYSAKLPVPESRVGNGSVKIQPPYVEPGVAAEFETILKRFKARSVEVVLLMPPYHPKVFRCESAKACAAMATVGARMRELARNHGFKIVGGFDPRPFGIGPEYFYDALHMDVSAIPLLIKPGMATHVDVSGNR